ncbi:MAG: hypothetical protein ABJG41_09250 [Cyclobacteriaceae bacterium]
MKKIYLNIALLLATVTVSFAQGLVAESYIEKTHISPKTGTAIGFEFSNKIELGAFYQKHTPFNKSEDTPEMPRFYEKNFAGVYFSYPIKESSRTEMKFKVRTGVSNGQNFAITPSLHSNFKLTNRVKIGAGLGIRAFRPTLQSSIRITL